MRTVEVPIPPSANNLWRVVRPFKKGGGRAPARIARTEVYESWLQQAKACLRAGLKPATAYPVRIRIAVVGGKGWRADRDLGNCDKAVEDALKHAGIIKDDKVKYVTEVVLTYEPGNGVASCCVGYEPVQTVG